MTSASLTAAFGHSPDGTAGEIYVAPLPHSLHHPSMMTVAAPLGEAVLSPLGIDGVGLLVGDAPAANSPELQVLSLRLWL